MEELAADASVVAKWFKQADEPYLAEAQLLRERFLAGALNLVAPSLLFLELLNTAARRWRWSREQVDALAADLQRSRFDLREPQLSAVARWTGLGLSAYDACYVATAAERGVLLVTTDEQIVSVAPSIARHLRAYA